MKLYLLKRIGKTEWDEVAEQVVAAKDEDGAYKVSYFHDRSDVTIEIIGTAKKGTKESVICTDTKEG